MMQRLVWSIPLALLALGGALLAAGSPFDAATARAAAALEPAAAEAARIQAHLAAVERELLARDVSHLTAEQRASRARHIAVLREYRERGVFPHNHDFPGERVPYFVDEHGTLCAMAYLIARSGRTDLVERVAETRNNARVRELAADAELGAWLEDAGLTLEEAARIQPMYGCCWVEPDDQVSDRYAVASALTSGLGGVTIGLNLAALRASERSGWAGVLGIGAGAAGLALGVGGLLDGDIAPARLGAVNAGIGALALGLGTWQLVRTPDKEAERPASVSATPYAAAEGGVGLLFHTRF